MVGTERGSRRKKKHSAKTVRLGFLCTHRCYFHERVLYLLLMWDKRVSRHFCLRFTPVAFPLPLRLILSSSLLSVGIMSICGLLWALSAHPTPLLLDSSFLLIFTSIFLLTFVYLMWKWCRENCWKKNQKDKNHTLWREYTFPTPIS